MWGSNSEGIERGRGNLMAIGQAYPIANAGLFVKVGIGVAAAITEGNVTGTSTATGFGPDLGVGYEFQPGGTLLIAVAADWLIQVIDLGQGTSTTSFALFTVGIGTR